MVEQIGNWIIFEKFQPEKQQELMGGNAISTIQQRGIKFGKVISAPDDTKLKKGDIFSYMEAGEYPLTYGGKSLYAIEKQVIFCKYEKTSS